MALQDPLLLRNDEESGDQEAPRSEEPAKPESSGGWKACAFILGTEFCQKLCHTGIFLNMVVYLTTVMHQGNATAAQIVTTWEGTSNISCFVGAFLADAFWGRYRVLGGATIIYACGMILLTLSAMAVSSHSAIWNSLSTAQVAMFYIALYLVGLGLGGTIPCVPAFGADQFQSEYRRSSFFNWYYFVRNVGALLGSGVIVYIQDSAGWVVGFGVPAVSVLIASSLFLAGTPWYRRQSPGGSPLTRIAQVLVAAAAKWSVEVPSDASLLHELPGKDSAIRGSRKIQHSNEFRPLDKAATPFALRDGKSPNPWRLCTVTQVEEVKMILRILPVWACTIVYYTAHAQTSTLFVEQAQRMDRRLFSAFEMPAASMAVFNTLSLIICLPLYDVLLVPVLEKLTGRARGLAHTKRIGIGILLMTVAMLAASGIEIRRLNIAAKLGLLDNDTDPVPMSILWQALPVMIIGVSELFTSVGQIEFFYDQAPDAMKSLGGALSLSSNAIGDYLSSFLVKFVSTVTRSSDGSTSWIMNNLNRGHLDYFFMLLALLTAISAVILSLCLRWYRYKTASELHAGLI